MVYNVPDKWTIVIQATQHHGPLTSWLQFNILQ